MTGLLLAALSLLADAPTPEVTQAFDPFVVVGVCPVTTGTAVGAWMFPTTASRSIPARGPFGGAPDMSVIRR